MRVLWTLTKREFLANFLSPVAYVAIALFLLGTGVLFALTVGALTETGPDGVEYPMRQLFGGQVFCLLVFAVLPPVLTMRLLAEERGTGTLEALLTAPVRDWQVVLGKYLGALLFYVALWVPTLAYVPVLVDLDWATGRPRFDPWPVATTYVGVLAAGAMFLAIGLFASALVKNQLVAFLIAAGACVPFVAVGFLLPVLDPAGDLARAVEFVSVTRHLGRDFTRGVLDTRHLILYATVAAFALYLTVVSLDQRRLRA